MAGLGPPHRRYCWVFLGGPFRVHFVAGGWVLTLGRYHSPLLLDENIFASTWGGVVQELGGFPSGVPFRKDTVKTIEAIFFRCSHGGNTATRTYRPRGHG